MDESKIIRSAFTSPSPITNKSFCDYFLEKVRKYDSNHILLVLFFPLKKTFTET